MSYAKYMLRHRVFTAVLWTGDNESEVFALAGIGGEIESDFLSARKDILFRWGPAENQELRVCVDDYLVRFDDGILAAVPVRLFMAIADSGVGRKPPASSPRFA